MSGNSVSGNWRVFGFLLISIIAIGLLAAFFSMAHPSTKPNGPASAVPATSGSISVGQSLTLYSGASPSSGPNSTISSNFSDSLKKFNSPAELEQWVSEYGSGSAYGAYGSGGLYRNSIMDAAISSGAKSGGIAPSIAPAPSGISQTTGSSANPDYSTTNIQVAGVDEADYVKTDGRYIYLIADNRLLIVDGKDPANAKIISNTTLFKDTGASGGSTSSDTTSSSGTSVNNNLAPSYYYNYYYNAPQAREMFINNSKLVLIAQVYRNSVTFSKYDISPMPQSTPETELFVFDVQNRSAPKLDVSFNISGSYYQSRMVGDDVYIVTQEGVSTPLLQPPVVYSAKAALRPDIYYFDSPEQNYQFNTVAAMSLSNESIVDAKTFMLGYSNTLMMSQDNLYIAYQKQNSYYWPCRGLGCGYDSDQYSRDRFFTVVVPLLPADLQANLTAIGQQHLDSDKEWRAISQELGDYFQPMLDSNGQLTSAQKENYSAMMENIQSALAEYDTKKAIEDSKTVIQKLGVANGQISYAAKAEVPGRLLNQFSLDEFNGNLRVATTTDVWVRKRVEYNNVFVLDSNMRQIGALEDLAPDESIYATRFMGERLYMVTYQQVDPLFVIDLSTPSNPKTLGTLNISGFSDYLHPVNATTLIGVGKETSPTSWGGVVPAGIKVALFDVSDPANPKEIDHVDIGDYGSDSEALTDHRAFLYSDTSHLLVLPVSVVKATTGKYYDQRKVWDGVGVYKVGPEGFTPLGSVKHASYSGSDYSYDRSTVVHRSLYIGDALYTFSDSYMKVNRLVDGLPVYTSIDLPFTSPYYGGPIYY